MKIIDKLRTLPSVQRGVTLIELMIVVVIVAILVALAIPAYQDYTIRSQAAEGMQMAAAAKTAVEEFYADKGTLPTDNETAGLGTNTIAGKYVASVAVGSGGVITVTFDAANSNANIQGDTLAFTPATDANTGSVTWNCGPGTTSGIDMKYLPSSCRSTGT